MPDSAIWVLVGLAVLLVAFIIPVLIQLRQTLKVAEDTLNSTGRRLDETLAKVAVTLDHVNRASNEMEHGVRRLGTLLEALGSAGDGLGRVRSTVGSVAAIAVSLGSVVMDAFRAMFGRREDPPPPEPESIPTREEITR